MTPTGTGIHSPTALMPAVTPNRYTRSLHSLDDPDPDTTDIIGDELVVADVVTSTQDAALTLLRRRVSPIPSFLLVAEEQTRGRGSHSRPWQSDPGHSLCATYTVPHSHCSGGLLQSLVPVALVGAIRDVTQGQVAIKWPNDIIAVHSRSKVGGILIEGHTLPDPAAPCGMSLVYLVGIGVNIGTVGQYQGLDSLPGAPPDVDPISLLACLTRHLNVLLSGDVMQAETRTERVTEMYHSLIVPDATIKTAGRSLVPVGVSPEGGLLCHDTVSHTPHTLVSSEGVTWEYHD
ncbi:biotin--acetyl-CoA-carboxylase ligase [Kipferlia bialata]|uniref:Biotin--acetyl-CoA-carboxylase ligase n=1 Tax=Kipferlia bialata TaxID=797122 RepID=A0A9K3GGQ2_9EUKA|nr:biotin--acetyl-CoA-carboxylase ligase [Kipferlia bialata]|eukprot:g2510.t1